jgi:predicted dehydrogenase
MDKVNVGFIGCGSFAQNMHMPLLLQNDKYSIIGLMDINELAAKQACKKFQGEYYTTDLDKLLNDESIDVIFITTRHNLHADLCIKVANAKKHIMCEKPMALNYEDCIKVAKAVRENNVKYTIGYNRGLAPLVTKAKQLLAGLDGKIMAYHRIQAPFPESHWAHIEKEGGGRFVGEGCHIFDLFCRIIGKNPVSVYAAGGIFLDENIVKIPDSATVTITFEDGSVASTLICSTGCADFEKEVTEIYCDNKAIYINGFKELEYYGFEGHEKIKIQHDSVDKGQRTELDQLADAILNDTRSPTGIDIALKGALISYKVVESIKKGKVIKISESEFEY